jgi:hypothetical protein
MFILGEEEKIQKGLEKTTKTISRSVGILL